MIGSAAPDFSLFDHTKKKVTLSEYKGKNIILLFFPQAFTSVCTEELCSVSDNMHHYETLNALVFGISVDSVFTLGKYHEDQQYHFPLLSDFNKEVSKAYNTLYDTWIFDMQGVSKRSAFIIDKEGLIRYAEVLENPGLQPDFNAIKSTLASL